MSKRIVFMTILNFGLMLFACDKSSTRLSFDISDFTMIDISKKQYLFSDNWSDIVSDGIKIKMGYKLQRIDNYIDKHCISEIVYFFEKDGNIELIGHFSKNMAFLNAFGEEFLSSNELKAKSSFMRTKFVGLSLSMLNEPFTIRGIATMEDSDEIFETEVMGLLYIDSVRSTIAQYLIQW